MSPDLIVIEDFIAKHPFAAAQVLEGLKAEDVAEFVRELPKEMILRLLNFMNIQKAAKSFSLLPSQLSKELMESSDINFAESLCRQFKESFRNDLLARLSPDLSSKLTRKLEQVANTVGALMVPTIVVNKEMVVKNALETIKRNKESLESYLYVVNTEGTFEGVVRLEELLFAGRNAILADLMITEIPKFLPDTPIQKVLDHPAWFEYRFIPVIDRSEKLLGALPFRTTRETTLKKGGQMAKEILETGTALGELYLIGLSGFLQSVGKRT